MNHRKTLFSLPLAALFAVAPILSAWASDPGPGGVLTATNVFDVGQPYQESFENFVPGDEVFLDGDYGWYGATNVFSGDNRVYVTNMTYTWGNNYPIGPNNPTNPTNTTRTNVLFISGWVTNRFAQPTVDQEQVYIDMMVHPLRSYEPEITVHDQVEDDVQMAAYVNSNGHLVIWHAITVGGAPSNTWTALDHWPIDTNDWARLTVMMDYDSEGTGFNFFKVRLNESTEFYDDHAFADPSGTTLGGTYFLAADADIGAKPYLSDISFSGDRTFIDDLVVQVENPFPAFNSITVVNHNPAFGEVVGNPEVFPGGTRTFYFYPVEGYGVYQVVANSVTALQGPQQVTFSNVTHDDHELDVYFGPTIEAAKTSAPSSIADLNAGILPAPHLEYFATNPPHYNPKTLSFTLAYPLGSEVTNTVWADEGYHIVSVTTNGQPVESGGTPVQFGQDSPSHKTNFEHIWDDLDIWGTGTGSVLHAAFDIDKHDLTIYSLYEEAVFNVIDSEHGNQGVVGQNTALSGVPYTNDWNTLLNAQIVNSPINLSAQDWSGVQRVATQYVTIGWNATGNDDLLAAQPGFDYLPNYDEVDGGIYWHTNQYSQTPDVNLTNDATVTFHWATNYWLETSQDGAGSLTMEIEGEELPVVDGWVAKDQVVKVTAAAIGPPAFFLGWSGDTNGATFAGDFDEIMTLPMDQARHVKADFNWKTMTVTSAHGGADPETATYLSDGTVPDHMITNSPVEFATDVKYTVNGWIGTGSVPAYQEGVDDPALMPGYSPMEADSSITWLWTTQYWYSVEAGPNGAIAIHPPHDTAMVGDSDGPWWNDPALKYKASIGTGGWGPQNWSTDRSDSYLLTTLMDGGGALFSIANLMAAADASEVSPIVTGQSDGLYGYGEEWKGGAISPDLARILVGNATAGEYRSSLPLSDPWTKDVTVFAVSNDHGAVQMDGLEFSADDQYLYSNIGSPSGERGNIWRWNVGDLEANGLGLTRDAVYTTSVSRIRNISLYQIDGRDLVYYGEGISGDPDNVYVFDTVSETETLLIDSGLPAGAAIYNVKVAGIGLGQMHLYVHTEGGALDIFTLDSAGKSVDAHVKSFTKADMEAVIDASWSHMRAFEVSNDESHAFFGHHTNPDDLNVVWAAPKFTSGELWVDIGEDVTVDAIPDPGYQFATWLGDATGDLSATNMTVTMDQARFLTATFEGIPQTVTVTSLWGGAWFDAAYIGEYLETDEYRFDDVIDGAAISNSPLADANFGSMTQYVAVGWTATGSAPAAPADPIEQPDPYWSTQATEIDPFTIQEPTDIVWNWKTNVYLDVSIDGLDGTVSVSTNGVPLSGADAVDAYAQWISLGTELTLTVSPTNGYTFRTWRGDTNDMVGASDDLEITVTMDRARTIYASFNDHTLDIVSQYGWVELNGLPVLTDSINNPALFSTNFAYDTWFTNIVVTPKITMGTTQYVVQRWIGSGSVSDPADPVNTNYYYDVGHTQAVEVVTEDSAIVWQWATNYWLDTAESGFGTITVTNFGTISDDPWWQDPELKYMADLELNQGYGPHYWSKDRDDQFLSATLIDAGLSLFSIPELVAANNAGEVSPIAVAFWDDFYGNNWKGSAISADLGRVLAGNAYPHDSHASLPVTAPWTTNQPSPTVFEILHDGATDLAMDGIDFSSDSQYLYANIASPSAERPNIWRWNVGDLDADGEGLTLDTVYTTSVSRIRNLAVYGIAGTDLVFYGEGVGGEKVYAFDPEAGMEHLLVDDALVSADIMNVKVAGIGLGQMHLYVQHNNGLQVYRLDSDGKSTDGLVASFSVADLEVILEDTWSNLRAFEVTNDESHAFFGHQGNSDALNVVTSARFYSPFPPDNTGVNNWVAKDSVIQITPNPASGSHFRYWIGDGVPDGQETDPVLNVTMDQAREIEAVFYVTTNYYHVDLDSATPAEPYDSWANASTNIQMAINKAQADASADPGLVAIVLVADGTYEIENTIEVTNTDASQFIVRSMSGAESTILDGGNSVRVLLVNDAGVTVEGFTIQGGLTADTGGGGARIDSNGGIIRYCIFTDNISSNTAAYSGGGGLHMRNGIVENSLFYNNHAAYGGGGIFMESAAEIRNCTIVSNEADEVGGGLYSTAAGNVYNSIIRFNTAPVNSEISVDFATLNVEYTATSDPSEHEGDFGGTDGSDILLEDPIFEDAAALNFRPTAASPTVDAGSTNYTWVADLIEDLDGRPRLIAVTSTVANIDMGAYETPRPITVTAEDKDKVYDGQVFPYGDFTAVYAGFMPGDDENDLGGELVFTGDAITAVNAGMHDIVPGGLTSSDYYELVYVTGTLEIEQAPLTVSANDDSKTYGFLLTFDGTEFTVVGTLYGADSVTNVTLQSAGAPALAIVDDYDIVPSDAQGIGVANYDIDYANGTLTVLPQTPLIAVLPTADDIIYGQTLADSDLDGGSVTNAAGDTVPGDFTFDNPALAPDAGVTNVAVTFTPDDNHNYTVVSLTVNLTVLQQTPAVDELPTASAIVYGDTLADSSLTGGIVTNMAGAVVAGTFVYDNPAHAPDAGIATVSVTFTPDDEDNYTTLALLVNVLVHPQTPTVETLPVASAITYGQTLADSVLSGGAMTNAAGAAVDGSFAFDDDSIAPFAGVTNVLVIFTPTDTDNYTTAQLNVDVTVNKQTPTVETLPDASDIIYGQTLADSVLSGGAMTNAAGAAVDGSFAFDDATIAPFAGVTNVLVIFTPTDADNYTTAQLNVDVTVNKQTPTVETLPDASDIIYGQTLADSVLSGGAMTNAAGVAVDGSFAFDDATIAPFAGVTNVLVIFTPDDADNYTTAQLNVNVTVNKQTPTVETLPDASDIIYGQTLADSVLTGGAVTNAAGVAVDGSFAFDDDSIAPDAGVTNVLVIFTPDDADNYTTTQLNVDVTVNKQTPTVETLPDASDIIYGQTLADSVLTGGAVTNAAGAAVDGSFAFDDATIAPDAGVTNVLVIFTPDDADNYTTAQLNVDVTVAQQTPAVDELPVAQMIVEGETLADSALIGGVVTNMAGDQVAGAFTFDDPDLMPEAGVTNVAVTFTPDDAANYTTVSLEVEITIELGVTALGTPISFFEDAGIEPEEGDDWDDVDYYDSDGDGALNWEEYVAGTDPMDAGSVFTVLLVVVQPGQQPYIEWIGGTLGPVAPYVIQKTSDLSDPDSWEDVETVTRVDGLHTWEGDEETEAVYFYRVVARRDVVPNGD